jgi:cytoskeletal protein RodZ
MIEQEASLADAGADVSGSGLSDTFESRPIGEYLRRQRMLRGISTEELASITRIPVRSLERLESGQFDGETDGFARGFVRTVANAMGLDAEDAIARMLHEPTPSSWERNSSGRGVKQWLAALVLLPLLVVTFFILRAGWNVLLGTASTPGSREVVLWQDPVRALAEATGIRLDPGVEIDPRLPTSSKSPSAAVSSAGSATER